MACIRAVRQRYMARSRWRMRPASKICTGNPGSSEVAQQVPRLCVVAAARYLMRTAAGGDVEREAAVEARPLPSDQEASSLAEPRSCGSAAICHADALAARRLPGGWFRLSCRPTAAKPAQSGRGSLVKARPGAGLACASGHGRAGLANDNKMMRPPARRKAQRLVGERPSVPSEIGTHAG